MKKWLSVFGILAFFGLGFAQTLTLWTTEEQPKRMEVQRQIAERFKAMTGITVKIVPVTENQLAERITAAFAAGQLPDLVFHPVDYTVGWAAEGILDTEAATEVVSELGASTFAQGALALASYRGNYTAVPTDGWTQLLLYRRDLIKAKSLSEPKTFASILAAIEALHNPPAMYGFVAATDPSQVYFQQVFEHIALANGVRLVDEAGNITLNTPQMVETLRFYKKLAQASPPGNLYWKQSRELYMAGKAAQIIWSPFILDELAGLRDSVPVTAFNDPTTDALAGETGFVARLIGPNNPKGASYAQISYIGITADADVAAAKKFVKFLLTDAYLDWLSMAPEGKFPVRRGTMSEPTRFIDGWSKLKIGVDRKRPLGEIYPPEVVKKILAGLEVADRWGFSRGYGELVAKVYGEKVIPKIVRRYLDGELTAEAAAAEMQRAVEALK